MNPSGKRRIKGHIRRPAFIYLLSHDRGRRIHEETTCATKIPHARDLPRDFISLYPVINNPLVCVWELFNNV